MSYNDAITLTPGQLLVDYTGCICEFVEYVDPKDYIKEHKGVSRDFFVTDDNIKYLNDYNSHQFKLNDQWQFILKVKRIYNKNRNKVKHPKTSNIFSNSAIYLLKKSAIQEEIKGHQKLIDTLTEILNSYEQYS